MAKEGGAKGKKLVLEVGIHKNNIRATDGIRKVDFVKLKDGKLLFDGKRVTYVSPGTIIRTSSSPGCVYYFIGGSYVKVCT